MRAGRALICLQVLSCCTGALTPLNCWGVRLELLFDDLDVDKKGEIPISQMQKNYPSIAELVGLVQPGSDVANSKDRFEDVQRLCASLQSKGCG